MRIITFYTPEYEHYLPSWKASMGDRPHQAFQLYSRKNWRLNVGLKPGFIIDRLIEFDEPLFWIDVDAEIIGPCPLFDVLPHICDFAAHFQ